MCIEYYFKYTSSLWFGLEIVLLARYSWKKNRRRRYVCSTMYFKDTHFILFFVLFCFVSLISCLCARLWATTPHCSLAPVRSWEKESPM